MGEEKLPDLNPNAADGLAAVIRGAVSLIPVGGDIVSELILPHIKNQWQDRLNHFVLVLEGMVRAIPTEKLNKLLNSPMVANIIEEGSIASMRTYSEKRREEIAALVANSLKQEKINDEVTIALIQTLSELNDSEMIILISKSKYCSDEFKAKHYKVINGSVYGSAASDEEYFFALMHPKYVAHLVELHLLKPIYEGQPNKGGRFEKDWTPTRVTGHSVSGIGNKLLSLILDVQE